MNLWIAISVLGVKCPCCLAADWSRLLNTILGTILTTVQINIAWAFLLFPCQWIAYSSCKSKCITGWTPVMNVNTKCPKKERFVPIPIEHIITASYIHRLVTANHLMPTLWKRWPPLPPLLPSQIQVMKLKTETFRMLWTRKEKREQSKAIAKTQNISK